VTKAARVYLIMTAMTVTFIVSFVLALSGNGLIGQLIGFSGVALMFLALDESAT
jgi:hypothetical protein